MNTHAFSRDPYFRNGSFHPTNTAAVHSNGSLAPDAAIEAFVPATVIEVAVVELVFTQEEEAQRILQQQIRRFIGMVIPSVVMALIIVITVSILETNGKRMTAIATLVPSAATITSATPLASPTTSYLPQILQDLTAVSDPKALKNQSMPQYQAVVWISMQDSYVQSELLGGKTQKFLQRYILAAMYYTLGGDAWTQCGQHSPRCKVGCHV